MLIKSLLLVILITGVFAFFKRPFGVRGKLNELANHLLIALGTYYGVYILFHTGFGFDETTSMASGATVAMVVMVIVNMFFRKA